MSQSVKLTCLACGQGNRLPEDRLSAGAKCAVCGAALVPAKPVEIDLETLAKAIRLDDLPLLVDFWAPWCGPCRTMAPEFAKAASMLQGQVRLAKLNTEAEPEASPRYRIQGIPALALFGKGREQARLTGARPASQIVDFARKSTGVGA